MHRHSTSTFLKNGKDKNNSGEWLCSLASCPMYLHFNSAVGFLTRLQGGWFCRGEDDAPTFVDGSSSSTWKGDTNLIFHCPSSSVPPPALFLIGICFSSHVWFAAPQLSSERRFLCGNCCAFKHALLCFFFLYQTWNIVLYTDNHAHVFIKTNLLTFFVPTHPLLVLPAFLPPVPHTCAKT